MLKSLVPNLSIQLIRERLLISRQFDRKFYLNVNQDVSDASGVDPVTHYCVHGWKEGRDPTPNFSTKYYLLANPDVQRAGVNPFWHFLKHGKKEGRVGSWKAKNSENSSVKADELSLVLNAFDQDYYRARYPDVKGKSGTELVHHYCTDGWREGRDPSPSFSTKYYLEANHDVAKANINPFWHYLNVGRSEGRPPMAGGSALLAQLRSSEPQRIPWRHSAINPQNMDELVKLVAGDIGGSQKREMAQQLEIYSSETSEIFSQKICYTAQFGAYDKVQPILEHEEGVEYVCFTDNDALEIVGWRIVVVPALFDDPTRAARIIKALPHIFLPSAMLSLWVDGSTFIRDPKRLFGTLTTELDQADFLAHQHSQRVCVYDEATTCKLLKKDDEALIGAMMSSIDAVGYPQNCGLYETAQLFRRHCGDVALFNERWWEIIREFSRRDQLSFPFIAWRMSTEIKTMRGTQWIDQNFKNYLHKEAEGVCADAVNAQTAIVMLVRNQKTLTKQAITSICEKTDNTQFLLYVVDNGSDADTKSMLRDLAAQYSCINITWNEENFSFSAANNLAACNDQAKYICFVNNDIEVIDGLWLDRLISVMEADPDVGATGPILLYPDYEVQSAGIDIHHQKNKIKIPATEIKHFRQSRTVDALTGACVLVRRDVHELIGGFDERFWYGQEDIDYCLRLKEAGFDLRLVSEAEVIHHESKTRSFNFRSSYNRRLLFGKWDGRFGLIEKTVNARKAKLSFAEAVTSQPLRYRGYDDVVRAVKRNIHNLPFHPDLVVGIPRSGLFPATLIAQFLNTDLLTYDQFVSDMPALLGDRPRNAHRSEDTVKVLIVDDSINQGRAFERALEQLPEMYAGKKIDAKFLAIFGSENWYDESKVDILERCLLPRIFQWNYRNHGISQFSCFDLDGVLCDDPSVEQNDDGERYVEFLKTAHVKSIPKYPIAAIVTSRLEKYRAETEDWLGRNNVKYKELYMIDLPSAEERRRLKAHAPFKAEVYQDLNHTQLFVESEPHQAKSIFEATKKPVICTENDIFLHCENNYSGGADL